MMCDFFEFENRDFDESDVDETIDEETRNKGPSSERRKREKPKFTWK